MKTDSTRPAFLLQVEGQALSADLAREIVSFAFAENEVGRDVLELAVSDRNLQFIDGPLFQEGNEIVFHFGYFGNFSALKKAVIEKIDYEFREDGPAIRIKAYGKENQAVFQAQPAVLEYFTDREGVLRSFRPSIKPAGESRKIEAVAVTAGVPALRARRNVEVRGVGRKFSGVYYCRSVLHTFGGGEYRCELKLEVWGGGNG